MTANVPKKDGYSLLDRLIPDKRIFFVNGSFHWHRLLLTDTETKEECWSVRVQTMHPKAF